MKESTRLLKSENLLNIAEKIFFKNGFPNTKMEEIAAIANCSKTTLYSYFESKENLYMAVTHRALQTLIDEYHKIIIETEGKNGLKKSEALFNGYLNFSEKHRHYYQILLDYQTFIRAVSGKENAHKLSEAMRRSLYFNKVKSLHNMPMKLVCNEIELGQQDGSIPSKQKASQIYLTIWALIIGFNQITPTDNLLAKKSIFRIPVVEWKDQISRMIGSILMDKY